jgi:hypothetical protein
MFRLALYSPFLSPFGQGLRIDKEAILWVKKESSYS